MFPYRDENETFRTPVVTFALIAANAAAWFLVQGAGGAMALAESVCNLGLIPGELTLQARIGDGFPLGQGLACIVDPGRAPEHGRTRSGADHPRSYGRRGVDFVRSPRYRSCVSCSGESP